MLPDGWHFFAGKNILLLQGPVGPFFSKLASTLSQAGAQAVHKVNFNGGDWLFYPRDALNYRGKKRDWRAFLDRILAERHIDTIMLFGDCRPFHVIARKLANERSVDMWVFEEGYVRPDFVTMEQGGTNGHSRLPKMPAFYRALPELAPVTERSVGNVIPNLVVWGCLYGVAAMAGQPWFPHYRHHRPLALAEGGRWLRAAWRKVAYRLRESGALEYLVECKSRRYFLVSLQTAIDTQIRVHSRFPSLETFIEEVVDSFADSCREHYDLVFKHHPLDRGHTDYGRVIQSAAKRNGVANRVLYIHDQHLPTLLTHAAGLVVVNSTVGLSGIHHGLPVKVLGDAIYDMLGLTFQGRLDRFWDEAASFRPDMSLYRRFRSHVIDQTQLNGSFYSGDIVNVVRRVESCACDRSEHFRGELFDA
ncbi:capsule polysaccharide biosynthesis family protein [Burkholderia sp. MSHR3999]|uniref:capsule biosynthesis protein n=1 Tax=Burkholderia sp. MSHR3999 TaxID=1542965 RepID=UPI0005AC861E|nr:capsular biosynthesis protein [Burkholderia sp. MSHR3999]KIP17243.1 capsule polysaccharide biosynthesis family protein [Burkholderia sp. MSHR3999]